ncbi:ROK family protein [Chamaesiphon polymorphus]|uniref:ROK family protein n=1 Tax=Chamaesiphon polymorphus CCALA 037 TaxID=2107692 RepID=A0A2T1FGC3_9CYAN|nr:ROK family protein [Chamaesiphon polymorphus]PSB44055.1 ROK family protein [Chamaesiphon polymorphus CCALA 037]
MTTPIQVGIDIGGTKMLAIARSSDIHARSQITTGKDFSADDAQKAIDRFIHTLSTPPDSIGIAVPGLVDPHGVVIACDVLPQLVGWQPAIALASICKVNVLNDAEAALMQVVSNIQPQAVAAVVMVGTGIGAAIYAHGMVLRGANGWAGELGSIPIEGKTLDAQASGAAILQELGVDIDRLSDLVAAGDSRALQAIEQAGSKFGLGLATLINLLNPEAIVLAGGTLRWQGYLEAALESVERHSLDDLRAVCSIEVSPHGGDLVALGATRSILKC